MGLWIVVQGFATPRPLGAEPPAGERIRSVRLAPWIASGVCPIFIALITVMARAHILGVALLGIQAG